MNVRQRRKLFAGAGLITMLLGALLTLAPMGAGAAGVNPNFQGNCVADGADSGDCVLDEPMGNNPATHGTVSYTRTGDSMTFVVNAVDSITEIQICMTVVTDGSTNPYVPTAANTCAGNTADRVYVGTSSTIPVDLTKVPNYASGDDVYFTLHVVAGGRTLAVTGGAGTPPPPPPESADLTIVKIVDEEDPADDLSFDFTFQPGVEGEEDDFGLGHQDSESFDLVPGDYTVTETVAEGYDLDDVACYTGYATNEQDDFTATEVSDGVTVTLANGDDVTCVFTNAPETTTSPTYSIVVDKVNNANGTEGFSDSEEAPTANAAVPFQLTITNDGTDPVTIASVSDTWPGQAEALDVLALADLDCDVTGGAQDVELDGLVLDPADVVVCTFRLSNYSPAAGGSKVNTITVDTEEGADDDDTSTVTTPRGTIVIPDCIQNPNTPFDDCSFVPPPCIDNPSTGLNECNPQPPVVITDVCPDMPGTQRLETSCVEVLPSEQERPPVVTPPVPPAQTPPQAQPEQAQRPAVLGVQTTRQLPRTGSESENLAGFGAGFLLLGVGLVITSRARRYGIAD